MELNIGFINLFEACSFTQPKHPFLPHYYQDICQEHSFDLLFLAECPIDNTKGESTFAHSLGEALGLRNIYCHASDIAFIGASKYSGIAILSRFPLNQYRVTKYFNPQLSITKDDGSTWHTHDKFIQSGEIILPNESRLSIINTHVLPLTIFGYEMNSELGIKIFNTLETVLNEVGDPLVLAGDFNLKNTPFQSVLQTNSSRLNFATNALRTSAVNELFKGAQIAISKSLTILDSWAVPTQSDCYLLGVTIETAG